MNPLTPRMRMRFMGVVRLEESQLCVPAVAIRERSRREGAARELDSRQRQLLAIAAIELELAVLDVQTRCLSPVARFTIEVATAEHPQGPFAAAAERSGERWSDGAYQVVNFQSRSIPLDPAVLRLPPPEVRAACKVERNARRMSGEQVRQATLEQSLGRCRDLE